MCIRDRIKIALRVHVVVQRISSNISGFTGLIFAMFSPYERALSIPYFPICQGTLPWQPNNIAVMKANWYYVHSLQFGRWSTVLFRYYLPGGDTVAPSRLLARLCHACLVSFIFAPSKASSVSPGPIFTIFSPNGWYLREFSSSGPFFWFLKGRCHGNQFCGKITYPLALITLSFRNGMG